MYSKRDKNYLNATQPELQRYGDVTTCIWRCIEEKKSLINRCKRWKKLAILKKIGKKCQYFMSGRPILPADA